MSTAPAARPEIGSSQIVEASAGTGKTLTHAGAGEMKWRMREGLDRAGRGVMELYALKDPRRLS